MNNFSHIKKIGNTQKLLCPELSELESFVLSNIFKRKDQSLAQGKP